MPENFNTDVKKLLNQILRLNNSIFVFQTDILKTSIKYSLKPNYVANEIISNIEKIFKKKTILFPAFSNDLVNFKKYDIKKSSIYTGTIPKLVLKRNYYRTHSFLHSFLAKGPYVRELKKLKQETTWGKGSVFEWLEKKNAIWVALNLDWERGCAFAHRSEELHQVGYRYFKIYEGKLYKNGTYVKKVSEKKYSNYPTKIIKDYSKSFSKLKKKHSKLFFINQSLYANVAKTKNITDDYGSNFKNDKFFGIKNKTELKKWLKKNQTYY
jgi:hypothetical protein